MEPASFSTAYAVRTLTEADVPAICALRAGNPLFYEYSGTENSPENAKSDLSATPPGKELKDKYFVGFYDGETLVAVLDLIDGYPEKATAFIGFFMVERAISGRGVGSAVIAELCGYLRTLGFERVRLAIDKGNPQSLRFWKKNGFSILHEAPRGDGSVYVAEKPLFTLAR